MNPELQASDKVALLLYGNFGDLLLLEPVLRRCADLGIRPDLYCSPETACVWAEDTRLNRIFLMGGGNQKYVHGFGSGEPQPVTSPLKPRTRYDHLFDFWPTGRTHKLAWRLRAKQKHTWDSPRWSRRVVRRFIYDHLLPQSDPDHRRDRKYLELFGLRPDLFDHYLPARLSLPEGELARFRAAHPVFRNRGGGGRRILVIQPTARWIRKLWPASKWRELIRRIQEASEDLDVVLIAGPSDDEKDMLREIGNDLVPPENHFAGSLSWRELACALACADSFAGLDSAPAHLAAMLGLPLVVLFGPTNEKEWGPVLPRQLVVKAPNALTAAIELDAVSHSVNTILAS